MNAVMGPAIRVRRSGGLVPAKTPTAAARVNPGGIPSAGWLVVQNNGVAKSVGEGALTVGLGEAGEGTTTWLGSSGLAAVNVSDWVMWGEVSVPVIRLTSVAPNARGANSFWINSGTGPRVEVAEVEPPCASPQAIMMRPLCGAGSNCGERAKARQRQKDASQDYKQSD